MSRSASILALLLWLPLPALAEGPDWESVAEVETIQVLSESEDGTRRDTTVWLIVVDGQGYIRTGGTSWGENVQRDPEIEIRIEEEPYEVTASFVEDEELRQQISDAFREKYGFTDVVMSPFRGDHPLIMRLTPR